MKNRNPITMILVFLLIVVVGAIALTFLGDEEQKREVSARTESNTGTHDAIYTNEVFKVTFRYPSSWHPNKDYMSNNGVSTRYDSTDGYFGIDAGNAGKNNLADAITSVANHALHPYGDNPTIEKTTIDGMESAYILPQGNGITDASLIVRYPRPIEIVSDSGGKQNYTFFVLYGDKLHIKQIAATLSFIN